MLGNPVSPGILRYISQKITSWINYGRRQDKRWWGSGKLCCLRKAQRDQWKKLKSGKRGQLLPTETEDRADARKVMGEA